MKGHRKRKRERERKREACIRCVRLLFSLTFYNDQICSKGVRQLDSYFRLHATSPSLSLSLSLSLSQTLFLRSLHSFFLTQSFLTEGSNRRCHVGLNRNCSSANKSSRTISYDSVSENVDEQTELETRLQLGPIKTYPCSVALSRTFLH